MRDSPAAPEPVLLATGDAELIETVTALAAAAGASVSVERSPAPATWRAAPLVLAGVDVAEPAAGRRGGVLLLAGAEVDPPYRRALEIGADAVVVLPDEQGWLVERLGEAGEGPGRGGTVVGVLGGRGGAGASCLATAIAITAARRGQAIALVDADDRGGGLDLLMGAEGVAGVRWQALAAARGRIPSRALESALPQAEGVSVLAWDRSTPAEPARGAPPPACVTSVLSAARRGFTVVVLDLPRYPSQVGSTALAACDVVLVLVPADVQAVSAARAAASDAAAACPDVRAIVRVPAPSGLDAVTVAGSLGLPLLAELGTEQGLSAAIDRGEAPGTRRGGPLARCAEDVVRLLGLAEPAGSTRPRRHRRASA